MLEAEESKYTIQGFIKDMHPYTMTWHRATILNLLTFWTEEEEEEEEEYIPWRDSCSMVALPAVNSTKKWSLKELLKDALSKIVYVEHPNVLIQFWAPIITSGGRPVLQTSNQPFALYKIESGLCEYRKHCFTLEYDVFPQDEEVEDDELGIGILIARVFKQEKSLCEYYHTKHQTGRSLILPLFRASSRWCVGVLELVDTCISSSTFDDLQILAERLTQVGTWIFPPHFSLHIIKETTEEDSVIMDELNKVMQDVCTTHQLPLAQIWSRLCISIPSTYADSSNKRCRYPSYLTCSDKFSSSICNTNKNKNNVLWFNFACRYRRFRKNCLGVVGHALLSHKPCFSEDVTQLPVEHYPLAADAAFCGLTGCYAICLHITTTTIPTTGTRDYVLEFFLPPNWNTTSRDLETSLKNLLATVKDHLQLPGFKICSVGEEPCVKGLFEVNCDGQINPATLPQYTSSVSFISEPFSDFTDNETLFEENLLDSSFSEVELGYKDIDAWSMDFSLGLRLGNETTELHLPSDDESAFETSIKKRGTEVIELSCEDELNVEAVQQDSNILVTEKNNVAVTSSKRTCREETLQKQRVTNEQHIGKKLDDVADRHSEESSAAAAAAPSRRKKSRRAEKTEDVYIVKRKNEKDDIQIRHQDLIDHKDMILKEAADSIGIGKTKMRDACRHFGYPNWPPKEEGCVVFVDEEERVAFVKRKKVNPLCSSSNPPPPPPPPPPMDAAHPIPNSVTTTQRDTGTMTTYLKCRDKTFSFRLPFSSTVSDLRDKVSKKVSLDEVSFEIKYRDDNNILISIVDDEDLEDFISFYTSLGEKNAEKGLMVLPITTNQSP